MMISSKFLIGAIALLFVSTAAHGKSIQDAVYVPDLENPEKLRLLNLEPLPDFVPAELQDESTVRFLLYTR